MKIIVHGSVFTDNFGDVLFADLFYSRLKKSGNKVFFLENRKYGISDFVRKEIGYEERCGIKDLFEADALVMLSGGYLGEDQFSKKKRTNQIYKIHYAGKISSNTRQKNIFYWSGRGPD